ncbi:MAG: hypothetical protein OXI43_12420 [Candidatus Poribacteria bacterium]|nr:hypothetical protein [Candidatus Poribacteria bacterium]
MSKLTKAQVIAASLWFNGGTRRSRERIKNDIPDALDITEAEVRTILKSDAYLEAVKALMMSTRSPRNIVEWINRPRNTPASFGKRMGLSWDDAAELMHAVLINAFQEQHKDDTE